jgi:hypothetical protein
MATAIRGAGAEGGKDTPARLGEAALGFNFFGDFFGDFFICLNIPCLRSNGYFSRGNVFGRSGEEHKPLRARSITKCFGGGSLVLRG